MTLKNIIFDFDGTLMDTAPVILATMKATIDHLGLPRRSETECRATIGLRLEDIPAKLFPDQVSISREYAAVYRELFNDISRRIEPVLFDGVSEVLSDLQSRGYRMAVSSSRSHRSLDELIRQSGLTECFEMIIGGDDVNEGKPSAEPVDLICRSLGWSHDETLVVGDASFDIIMGKTAGCTTCGVSYGNGDPNDMAKAGADHIIPSFIELLALCPQKTDGLSE